MTQQAIWQSENERNVRNRELFEAIIRTVYPDVTQVGCGHHLMFSRANGTVFDEYPSADHLIFDHTVAKAIFGEEHYLKHLAMLAQEPVQTRDALLGQMFYEGLPNE